MNHNRRQLREITTSGSTGGFQSSVVGFVSPLRRSKKMTPTQADRSRVYLKRAAGLSESSMFRQNQKVNVHFGSGSGPFSTSKGVVKSAYKIQGDKFVDVVMDGDSKDDHTTFMWNGKTWVVYMDNQEEDAVKIQAESQSTVVKRIDAVLEALSEAYTGWEELDDTATDLRLFIDNDGDLNRSMGTTIYKNVMTKIGQGKYNRDLAVTLFMYLVDAGAQKYVKEQGTADQPWNKLFPKKLRELVATSLRNAFETEAALGNYDNYLPAKYRNTDVAAVLAAAGFKPE